MIALVLATAALALAAAPDGACLPEKPGPGLGVVDPFVPPGEGATSLNAAGKTLYRQGRWEEARAKYRAAVTADPDFLAPRLNVACSFVRQERFAEATAEARALVERAFVPWSREVREAADLGALKVRPEMAQLQRATDAAAARWGDGLADAVIFLARQRAPLRVPETGEGVFILNPHQEAYAFLPATGLYRQLTAEDGHVLAIALTPDRRRLVYLTAEKLVRGPPTARAARPGAPAVDVALRGVTLGELTLATMTTAPPIRVDGDVRRLEIAATNRGISYRIERDGAVGDFLRTDGGALVPLARLGRPPKPLAVLTARGTLPGSSLAAGGACPVTAREVAKPDGTRHVEVIARGRKPRPLGDRFGAGLVGLPIP